MVEVQSTSAPHEYSARRWALRGALIALALLLIVFVVWGWRTYRQVTALRDQAREMTALRVERLDELTPALERMQDDVARLRRSLTIPMALAPHLGWLPRIGPTVQAAPTLLQAGELALSAGADIWRALEEPSL
jgi:C4-dicarboxylate-specific signal transduction histidine kinase